LFYIIIFAFHFLHKVFFMQKRRAVSEADRGMFAAMLEGKLDNYVGGYSPGERVKARVTAVREGFVVLDVRSKHEGLVDIIEYKDEDGNVAVKAGDPADVIFVQQREGALLFTRAAATAKAVVDQTVAQAKESGLPLEGLVQKEVTGGYEVTVAGKRAFCPYSQIDLFKTEGAVYAGKKFPFAIMEYDESEGNLVVSRRMLLEKERDAQKEALKQSLAEGQVRKGKVSRLADFGFFVDLGGMDGLVPLRELSWRHGTKPEEVVKVGDEVEVSVLSLAELDKDRVSLSLKALMRDPWLDIVEKYPPGAVLEARVTRIEKFGAFVDLGEGVEGLVGTGRLAGGRRIMTPREVVTEGQVLLLQVETVENDRRRIGWKPVDTRIAKLQPGELQPGMQVRGIVEGCRDFGVFVRLSETRTGLLHVAEAEVTQGGSAAAKLERAYPPQSEVTLVVKTVEGDKIGLTTLAKWQGGVKSDEEDETQAFLEKQNTGRESFGSLGDAFPELKWK
jgi:small subunit ribosomal protein S1